MKKSKYELLLSNDIIERVDYIAKRMATSRSATVNRLLGERLEIETPEGRIDSLYEELESYFSKSDDELIPFYIPGGASLYLVGRGQNVCLEIVIFEKESALLGEIHFHCRSRSYLIRSRFNTFFSYIRLLEGKYFPWSIGYKVRDCLFVRGFELKDERGLELLSAYMGMVNRLMKGYLAGSYGDEDLELEFLQYIKDGLAGI